MAEIAFDGIAQLTQEESRTLRGLPPVDALARSPQEIEIVDAEVLPVAGGRDGPERAVDGGTESGLLALDNLATCRRVGRHDLCHFRSTFQNSLLETYFVGQQLGEVEAALCAFNDVLGSVDRDIQRLLALGYEFTNLAVRLRLEPNAVYSVR